MGLSAPGARSTNLWANSKCRSGSSSCQDGDVDFDLTSEQQAIRDTCRDFAREVVAPAAEELDREHKFGYDVVRQMADLGLFGLPFSEEYGGAGGHILSLCVGIGRRHLWA